MIVSARLATLHELSTVYGIEEAYDLAEIIMVDAENERRANAHAERNAT